MSYTLSVFVDRARLPSTSALQQSLAAERLRLSVTEAELSAIDGFVPVIFDGMQTGFELHNDPVTPEDRDDYKQALIEDGEQSDFRYEAMLASDLWLMFTCRGQDEREVRAASLVARTIAAAAGGWFEDPQTREMKRY